MKTRILFCGEASYLSTGYGTYHHEVMSRLHQTDKYELAEHAAYGDTTDPKDNRWRSVPWKFFANMPDRNNKQEMDVYHNNGDVQFGSWKFEDTCLKFKPHVVVDIRDHWMLEHEERSPFRRFYHWAIMPTCDAIPQHESWLATYMNADAVFTYSDWALNVLNEQSRGGLKLKESAPPGADLKVFQPHQERRGHRQRMGIDEDCLIVGTIMRNQRRKLYPDLIKAFGQFLRLEPTLGKRTFLYLHTGWPDVGWDIPLLVKEAGLGHKCLFTYHCLQQNGGCGVSFPLFFSDCRTACRNCGRPTAMLTSSQDGISRGALNDVLNLFDVYVQYANSEGFGMPMVEAAAAGLPVMAVDYSAMSDVVRKIRGVPIAVQRMVREPETHCWRALPNNDDFVGKLIDLLSRPEPVRRRMGYEARKGVEEHYTYEKTAKKWEEYFDSIEERPETNTWGSPAQIFRPNTNVPNGLSDDQFVAWGMNHVVGRPDMANGYAALRMVRDLAMGLTSPQAGGLYFNELSTLGLPPRCRTFNRDAAMQEMLKLNDNWNFWETQRTKNR